MDTPSSTIFRGADRIFGLEKSVWVEFGALAKKNSACNLGQGLSQKFFSHFFFAHFFPRWLRFSGLSSTKIYYGRVGKSFGECDDESINAKLCKDPRTQGPKGTRTQWLKDQFYDRILILKSFQKLLVLGSSETCTSSSEALLCLRQFFVQSNFVYFKFCFRQNLDFRVWIKIKIKSQSKFFLILSENSWK